MGWIPWSSQTAEQPKHDAVEEKVFLEDLKPKYEPLESPAKVPAKPVFKLVFETITIENFYFSNLIKIPCFRDAGLIGLSLMGVLATTILLIHKNPSRAANWGVGGGLLGSLVGWEQCRTQRSRSFENVEKAKATVRAKPRPMVHSKHDSDDN